VERLSETVLVLYAELLDQARSADVPAELIADGSFVQKTIGEHRYWYRQKVDAGEKRQIYLGLDTPELLARIAGARQQSANVRADLNRRRELVSMLVAGGAAVEAPAFTTVLKVLADALIFRRGGVLVGTQAFTCYANMLGVRFEAQSVRTADIDVAYHSRLSVGMSESAPIDLPEELKKADPKFVAVPELDARHPSTSFKVRGRDLRVDFLTPMRGRETKPISIPHLGVAAQPLAGLDYLIERTAQAVVVGGTGILVNVPAPARYALHKIWVAHTRGVAEHAKSRKDLHQAEQLLDVLLRDRPGDVDEATTAMTARPKMWKRVKPELTRITDK